MPSEHASGPSKSTDHAFDVPNRDGAGWGSADSWESSSEDPEDQPGEEPKPSFLERMGDKVVEKLLRPNGDPVKDTSRGDSFESGSAEGKKGSSEGEDGEGEDGEGEVPPEEEQGTASRWLRNREWTRTGNVLEPHVARHGEAAGAGKDGLGAWAYGQAGGDGSFETNISPRYSLTKDWNKDPEPEEEEGTDEEEEEEETGHPTQGAGGPVASTAYSDSTDDRSLVSGPQFSQTQSPSRPT
jgi:hypothetical protein